MKLANLIFSSVLLLCAFGCSFQKKPASVSALHFNWKAPQSFQVEELAEKKENKFRILYKCELVRTNEGFVLQWLDAKITEFNGEKVSDSEDLRRAVEPIEDSFRYPPFLIDQNGQFEKVINVEESVKRADQMLDKVTPGRSDDNRKFFAKFGETETGRQVLNQAFGLIWQTWVEVWVDVELAEGQTSSNEGMTMLSEGVEMPAKVKLTNLGTMKSDTNLLSLKYEYELTGTNFTAALNDFIEKTTKETGIKGAGPITNECTIKRSTILEVQTERKTLKPHWAKRTLTTTVSAPGEDTDTTLEVHEYNFFWDSKAHLN
jgi:hypothetical protein